MKFTGIFLILMGVMLFLFGAASLMSSDPASADLVRVFPLNPMFTVVVAAASLIGGVLIVLYGGRGYSSTPVAKSPIAGPPTV